MSIDLKRVLLLAALIPATLSAIFTLSGFMAVALGLVDRPNFENMDFANYWIAGKLVLSGQALDLFGPQADYFAHMTKAFGPDYPWHAWSYPPHYLLFTFWTGFFSFPWALITFLIVTLGAMIWAVKALIGRLDLAVAAAMMPVVSHNIWVGQNGFLTAGLIFAGLALRQSRPIAAGILIGLLTVKPHFGILIPFLLLIERRWIVFATASLTTVFVVGISTILFGTASWVGFFSEVAAYQTKVMAQFDGDFLLLMPTVYGSFRSFGFAADISLWIHSLIAVPVFIATIIFFVRSDRADYDARTIVLLLSTFLVLPYSFTYDYALVAGALALIISRYQLSLGWLVFCLIGAYIPMILHPLAINGLTIAPLVLLGLFIWFIWMSFDRQHRLPNRTKQASPAAASN